ncbi:MAG TPA: hypothetical protein VG733_13820, partial [Chthoniobacteraceae bacterium]|nr:hypothetical protein [Chthoniobacteraceae bacterium]
MNSGPVELNEQASTFMHRGIALMNTGAPDALREAVQCFDDAIALRRKLPLAENAEFRYGLAAGLINRGDALTRLCDAARIDEAISSHTEAIGLLESLPLDDNALYLKRLAVAWINRGIALEAKGDAPALAEAIASFQKVVDFMGASPQAANAEFALIRAVALINHAGASLHSAGDAAAPAARADAESALALLNQCNGAELPVAEAGLKARHALCRALVSQLSALAPEDESTRLDLAGQITDAVEEGLRLVRDWARAGVNGFRPLGAQLFQVGTLVYERSQPQFLADFLLDHLDPE